MWAPDLAPNVPRTGWSSDPAPDVSGPILGWEPVVMRTSSGVEVIVLVDSGIAAAGNLSGVDVAAAHDAGLAIVPDLDGQDVAGVLESAVVVPVARGGSRFGTRDRAAFGTAWRRVESVAAHDSGVSRPGALRGGGRAVVDDSGRVRAAGRGDERTAAHDTGVGSFVPYPDDAVSNVYGTTSNYIPPAVRYIDVIILGAGGGGAGGSQGAPGWDGNGGQAGTYLSFRWDRGEARNVWTGISFVIGTGGTGGSRNSGTGGAGGTTNAWIVGDPLGDPNLSRSASGGAGGSGTTLGGGVSGAQNGKAPGNHSFQGITATGGGQNGGTPGGGGKGGGGSVWPLNPGSGETGARGQAWYRFS